MAAPRVPSHGSADEVSDRRVEVAVIGGGIAGMATAARLQARGVDTTVIESHSTIGGCAGYFRHRGFAFDVGATTFVDFEAEGAGAGFCREIGMPLPGDVLPGYVAWLPDRQVVLYRDRERWRRERLAAFGAESAPFWSAVDQIADVFWEASRRGVRLPMRRPRDLVAAMRAVAPANWPMARYLLWTFEDLLDHYGQGRNTALRRTADMLIQDTLHSSVEHAPLVNAALGISIRGAGLTRPLGGARGFFDALGRRYRELGGDLRTRTSVARIDRDRHGFRVVTDRGDVAARRVVSTLPLGNLARIVDEPARAAITRRLTRSPGELGGALVLHLGVPEWQVAEQAFTHHQILHDYDAPLGDGNNMFVSVSSPGDTASAPAGFRAVMISTHCEIDDWNDPTLDYDAAKASMTRRLLGLAHRVFPSLGDDAPFVELGTPRTYARFTGRDGGAVGGFRQTMRNTNQRAIGHDIGIPGFHVAGDSTWPGLGTVAAMIASRNIADDIAGPDRAARPSVLLPEPMPTPVAPVRVPT